MLDWRKLEKKEDNRGVSRYRIIWFISCGSGKNLLS